LLDIQADESNGLSDFPVVYGAYDFTLPQIGSFASPLD